MLDVWLNHNLLQNCTDHIDMKNRRSGSTFISGAIQLQLQPFGKLYTTKRVENQKSYQQQQHGHFDLLTYEKYL
ncbi:hypothetical protein M8C21_007776 [Ambrosia artemisiifolia]|uniref:Uncharacterized protein n=1 Tax=Ambrosia artemisiifolia TaxID=4212 RepID=A0AAD5BVZ4_AMBAR|nr:hypothetical protein M8C21_007776 [Ambrosia artemisiifolia]